MAANSENRVIFCTTITPPREFLQVREARSKSRQVSPLPLDHTSMILRPRHHLLNFASSSIIVVRAQNLLPCILPADAIVSPPREFLQGEASYSRQYAERDRPAPKCPHDTNAAPDSRTEARGG